MLQGEFTDVTLAASSPFFYKAFTESKQEMIYLKGVSSATLQSLMQFIYSGEVHVKFQNLSEFIALGKELQIKGLLESVSSLKISFIKLLKSIFNRTLN